MKRFFSDDSHNIALSILMVVIGLILVIWPGHVMTTAMTVLGIALLAGGVISILYWYRGRMRDVSVFRLAEGIVLAIAGLVVLCAPKLVISIIPLIVGIGVCLNGIFNLAQALDLRREGYENWVVSLALAILTLVLGLLIVFNPFKTMEALVVAIGVITLYNGVSNLWIESRYRRLWR